MSALQENSLKEQKVNKRLPKKKRILQCLSFLLKKKKNTFCSLGTFHWGCQLNVNTSLTGYSVGYRTGHRIGPPTAPCKTAQFNYQPGERCYKKAPSLVNKRCPWCLCGKRWLIVPFITKSPFWKS